MPSTLHSLIKCRRFLFQLSTIFFLFVAIAIMTGINDHILSTIVNNVHLLTSTHHNPFQTYSTIHLHNMTMMMTMRGVWLLYNCHVFKSKQIIIMQRQRWVQNGRLWWGVECEVYNLKLQLFFGACGVGKWAVDRAQIFFVTILSVFKSLFFLCRN